MNNKRQEIKFLWWLNTRFKQIQRNTLYAINLWFKNLHLYHSSDLDFVFIFISYVTCEVWGYANEIIIHCIFMLKIFLNTIRNTLT